MEAYGNVYTCGVWYLHHTSLIEAKRKEIANLISVHHDEEDTLTAAENELEGQMARLQQEEVQREVCQCKIRDAKAAIARDKDIVARDTADMSEIMKKSLVLKEHISYLVEVELPECQHLKVSLDNTSSNEEVFSSEICFIRCILFPYVIFHRIRLIGKPVP